MKLLLVPARQGLRWVTAGFAVFFKRPLAFAALFTLFIFGGLVSMMLPFVGAWLLLAALPLVSLAFMLATQRTLAGRAPTPGVFTEPLRVSPKRTRALIQMGLAYALASLLIIWLSDVADGGKFEALQDAMASGKGDASAVAALLGDPQLQFGLLLRFGLATLLALPFWHAPALVHWGEVGAGKALFFSTVACWRNFGAFLVYGLAWGGVILAFGAVANLLAALLAQPQLIALAAVPAGLLFSTIFYASLYFTVTDCFAVEDDAAAVAPEPA
ncbi:MAG TPA: BPSS1780 family membrane protein [Burkholderiaceae bacterium]|nr:BPSS1780 family membrane protein [Burkholderiaceae bacterium]